MNKILLKINNIQYKINKAILINNLILVTFFLLKSIYSMKSCEDFEIIWNDFAEKRFLLSNLINFIKNRSRISNILKGGVSIILIFQLFE